MNESKKRSARFWKRWVAANAVTPGIATRKKVLPGVYVLRIFKSLTPAEIQAAYERCGYSERLSRSLERDTSGIERIPATPQVYTLYPGWRSPYLKWRDGKVHAVYNEADPIEYSVAFFEERRAREGAASFES